MKFRAYSLVVALVIAALAPYTALWYASFPEYQAAILFNGLGRYGEAFDAAQQAVAVAKAVMWNSKLVILDEPTAALGVAQTEQVLALVRRLGEQGLAVVIISHNLHDIFETADRITVLRLGRNVGIFERAKTTQQEVVEAITAGRPTKVSGVSQTATTGEAS